MTERSDLTPKYDAAIQVKVCGRDSSGQDFEEISTAFPSSQGVMLEAVHQLQEGAAIEVTHLLTNRKETSKIRSLGPKLGVSTLVFLEPSGVDNFWPKDSAQQFDSRRTESNDAGTGSVMGELPAVPERGLAQISRTRIPHLDLFMTALNELVESSLEANLRPAVEQFTNTIPEHVAKAQSSVFANFAEQMETAFGTFGSRLDAHAQQCLALNENALIQKIIQLMEEAERFIQSRQKEFSQTIEETSAACGERSAQRVQDMASEAINKFRGQIEQQADEVALCFHPQLQNIFEQDLPVYEAQLREQLSFTAAAFRQKFLAQLEEDLIEKQQTLVERAERSINDLAVQNQKRVARLLRELAEAIESQAQPLSETADDRFLKPSTE